MKVGILEIGSETHYSPVILRARLFCDNPKNTVTIFVLKKMIPSLKSLSCYSNVNIVSLGTDDSLYRFLKSIEKNFRFDLFFITTLLVGLIPLWFFRPALTGAKLVLNIHSANKWFGLRKNFSGVKSAFATMIMWIWKKRANYISVGLESMKTYLIKNNLCKLPVVVIPFTFFEGSEKFIDSLIKSTNVKKKIRVVVPGVYSSKRRSYMELLSSLEKQGVQRMKDIEIELLGAPKIIESDVEHGLAIFQKAQALSNKGFQLVSHDRFVSREYFLQAIALADLIVSPINVEGHVGEKYGISKDSGVFSDIIESAKPACLPSRIRVPDKLEGAIIQYKDMDNLFFILESLIRDAALLNKYKIAAQNCASLHSIDSIRQNVFDALSIAHRLPKASLN